MMQTLIQIDAYFEQNLWNIDAEGWGDAVTRKISMMRIFMQIDSFVR